VVGSDELDKVVGSDESVELVELPDAGEGRHRHGAGDDGRVRGVARARRARRASRAAGGRARAGRAGRRGRAGAGSEGRLAAVGCQTMGIVATAPLKQSVSISLLGFQKTRVNSLRMPSSSHQRQSQCRCSRWCHRRSCPERRWGRSLGRRKFQRQSGRSPPCSRHRRFRSIRSWSSNRRRRSRRKCRRWCRRRCHRERRWGRLPGRRRCQRRFGRSPPRSRRRRCRSSR